MIRKKNDPHVLDFRERRRKRRRRSVMFGIALLCVLIGTMVWGVFYSSFFKIQEIRVIGERTISRDVIIKEVEAQVRNSSAATRFLGTEYLFLWPHAVAVDSLAHIPALRDVSLHKEYLARRVVIEIQERDPLGLWCEVEIADETAVEAALSTACRWFDREGVLFRDSLAVESGYLVKIVYDHTGRNLELQERMLPAVFLENFFSIYEALSGSGISAAAFHVRDLTREEVEVQTDGPSLLFSLRFRADATKPVLHSLAENENFKRLTIVDFRVENRVYYK